MNRVTVVSKVQKFATGKIVLLLFIATTCVYAWIVLASIPAVVANSPDMALFDMSPTGYSHAYAKDLLEAIGEQGRRQYLFHQLPADLIYPLLFAVTYTLILLWINGKLAKPYCRFSQVFFIPVLVGFFDYLENVGIFAMLISYPDISPVVVLLTSMATIFKSLLTVAVYILLLLLFIKWGRSASSHQGFV